MFSADLSWTDNTTEKVGQRRQRRANKRENSISSSTSGSKKAFKDGKETSHQIKSSLGSITKTISFSSVKDSMRRPSTAASIQTKNPSVTLLETSAPYNDYKDPLQQPDYIYSAKLGPRLPSGAVIESPPQQYSAPTFAKPVRTVRAQQVATFEESASEHEVSPPVPARQHRAWSVRTSTEAENICQSYEQVKDEILALQNPDAILPQNGLTYPVHNRLPDCPEYEEIPPPHVLEKSTNDLQRPPSMTSHSFLNIEEETPRTKYMLPVSGIESRLDLSPIFRNAVTHGEKVLTAPPVPPKNALSEPIAPVKVSQWSAPENWDIVKSQVEIRKILDSDSSNDDLQDDRRQSMFVGTHFQRFVRRMESAGPQIILERLKEEWDLPEDRAMSDELSLEKHLWALTALQLPSMDRFARSNLSPMPSHPLPPVTPKRRRKILELDGSIGEVYQLSAIYPNSRIYHFTRSTHTSSVPLPGQAVQHEICMGSPTDSLGALSLSTAAGVLPLPYANASMHHIRATRLPTLVPGSQLPSLLAECYRVLKPGGVLELRLMDATPERRSMGPLLATWLEDRLLISLEAEFKCTRPIMLVPRWARDAGFVPLPLGDSAVEVSAIATAQNVTQGMAKCLRLPAIASNPHTSHRDVVGQVGVLVSRALWKDAWGSQVSEPSDENERFWWWENPEIVEECREYTTTWQVHSLILHPPSPRIPFTL